METIERFCGDCHRLPLPSTFPKAKWPDEVRQGFQFYLDSKRTDLVEPTRQETIRYFQDRAPDRIEITRADSLKTEKTRMRWKEGPMLEMGSGPCATAHLVWDPTTSSLYLSDMQHGTIHRWDSQKTSLSSEQSEAILLNQEGLIYRGSHTCRIHLCDWNNDGRRDLLIGEMGSFPVGDHENGRVTLLLGNKGGTFEPLVLAQSLARVVSAIPFDYDEDGDQDILVAEFGWRKTGALKLLRNQGGPSDRPKMEVEIIDRRHGALGVEVADLDGDGRLDFVVVFAQEFESIEVFLRREKGAFERKVIGTLPDPSYNASSFQLVDLDRDGRVDVLLTCGDTLDAFIAKPYHGLRWFRNLGDGRWEDRDLGLLVGALHASVADFDGDGDLDIAGVGMFPKSMEESPGAFDSLCLWEQRDNLQFVRHSIERDRCTHATCAAVDIDQNGRTDLLVGEWGDHVKGPFQIYWNLTP